MTPFANRFYPDCSSAGVAYAALIISLELVVSARKMRKYSSVASDAHKFSYKKSNMLCICLIFGYVPKIHYPRHQIRLHNKLRR
jgi:hypothetical protein